MKGQMIRSFLFERWCSVLGIGHFQFVPRSAMYSLLWLAGSREVPFPEVAYFYWNVRMPSNVNTALT